MNPEDIEKNVINIMIKACKALKEDHVNEESFILCIDSLTLGIQFIRSRRKQKMLLPPMPEDEE